MGTRSTKRFLASMSLALAAGATLAGSDLNEVGALLVYPTIQVAQSGTEGGELQLLAFQNRETFVTITNAGAAPVVAHVSYINGEEGPQYCYECDFEIPLSGNDTEVLVIGNNGGGIVLASEDSPIEHSCPWSMGMLVVTLEDGAGNTLTDNVLLGEEVVVDYLAGTAWSIPAVSFQGGDGGDGDRHYALDGSEYSRMPRIVAADFLAPSPSQGFNATLSLFTLDFERQFPPQTDCSVTGFDANEHPFSASFQFGCWGLVDLCEISPEFCYPNLGLYSGVLADTHGWLQLNCKVDRDPSLKNGFDTKGGVHGAIVQEVASLGDIPAGSGPGFLNGGAAWARLLYQSVTTGDAVTLLLENPPPGMGAGASGSGGGPDDDPGDGSGDSDGPSPPVD